MDKVTRIFDEQSKNLFRALPGQSTGQDNFELPWKAVPQNAAPPPLFAMQFADGRRASFAYSDLRELHCPHAGRIDLSLLGMARYVITLEGRHLYDLLKLLESHRLLRLQESDPRDTDRPEKSPEIVKITITELPD